ncbi:hypothetical protein K432DRAFT_258955, partial [Lepidopterella palustris CBS 459.81]
MPLGIITSIAACPAIIGTVEAVQQGQKKNAKEKHRGMKSNLVVQCFSTRRGGREVNGGTVVLRDNKLYVEIALDDGEEIEPGHPFAGYFLPFPEQNWGRKGEGLVSTISDDPPQLNWVYMDADTNEIKYGLRVDAEPHIVGPWNCTMVEKRLTLLDWEGFMVVKEADGLWQLYFDADDNGLKGKVDSNKKKLEVELIRKELKKKK